MSTSTVSILVHYADNHLSNDLGDSESSYLLNTMSKYSDYQQARREFVVPQLFTAMLLNLIFGISWNLMIGTDADASSTLALGSQYAFSFLIMLYAVCCCSALCDSKMLEMLGLLAVAL